MSTKQKEKGLQANLFQIIIEDNRNFPDNNITFHGFRKMWMAMQINIGLICGEQNTDINMFLRSFVFDLFTDCNLFQMSIEIIHNLLYEGKFYVVDINGFPYDKISKFISDKIRTNLNDCKKGVHKKIPQLTISNRFSAKRQKIELQFLRVFYERRDVVCIINISPIELFHFVFELLELGVSINDSRSDDFYRFEY